MKTPTDTDRGSDVSLVSNKMKRYAVAVLGFGAYAAINPLRVEHVAILTAVVVLSVASQKTRDLAVVLAPLAVFGYLYDLLTLFQDRSYEVVIVEAVYDLEVWMFGWLPSSGGELGPVSYFRDHHHLAVDLLAGVWYSTHILTSFALAGYLWWMTRQLADEEAPEEGADAEVVDDRKRLRRFVWGFLLVNVIGFAFMAIWPVAPPWYVFDYGYQAPQTAIPGQPAGLARVDAFLGIDYFQGVYGQSKYVFGAMPSLHIACPTWFALHIKGRWRQAAAALYALLMAFFAVYLTHHYIVDLIAGAGLAWGVYALLNTAKGQEIVDRLTEEVRRLLGGAG